MGRYWWRLDLFSHFRLQYFLLLSLVTLIFFANWQLPFVLTSGGFALLNLALIIPLYRRPPEKNLSEKTYRVLLANVLQQNQQYHKLRTLIQNVNADFLVLIEVNEAWLSALGPELTKYPYSQSQMWENNYGLAFFSRLPSRRTDIRFFGSANKPSIIAELELDRQRMTVFSTHPPPPKSELETRQRDEQMLAIAREAAEIDGACMIVGDLNMTSWSSGFSPMIQHSKLRDSRLGFGVQPTWPTHQPLLSVPIDHLLVSSQIKVHNRKIGPPIGSDHRPILLDFSISNHQLPIER
jgi:endonuclease/exonuclease/phosphatase (EEP) superfamily protein YafD